MRAYLHNVIILKILRILSSLNLMSMPQLSTTNIFKICLLFLLMFTVTITVDAKQKSKEFVVVIDAGHGGKDVGAVEGKVVEKDINMGVAKYLEEYLKKKKIKVIMTRDGDKNVSLKDRALKANKANADLFISLHANSLPEDNANRTKIEGANIFVLGNENTADYIESVKRENGVITEEKNYRSLYGDFDPEDEDAYEIFANVKSDNLTNSLGFAGLVKSEFEKAGRKFRGIHEAGFVVLKETNMPSVLIELDYMCNPNQARYLFSTSGQKRLANGIANAVVSYRDALEKKGPKAFAAAQETQPAGDVYVLPTRKCNSKRDDVAPSIDQSTGKQSSTLPRRRRSESSRRASSKRDVTTENIPDPTEYGTAVQAVMSNSIEENGDDISEGRSIAQSSAKGKNAASADKNTKDVAKAEEKSVKKKEDKKKEDKKEPKKSEEEGEYRTYGNKKVLVKNVNSGSSSVVSLKSNKPDSEKDATTARFQVPEDQEEPVAEAAQEKKGSRFVDKADAEAKAAQAEEKERIESEKRAEKARKDEMKRSEKEERRLRAEEESEQREMEKQQKKQDAADAKAQKAAEKKQRELAEKEQKEANKQHRIDAEQDKYNSGSSNHEDNNKQYEAAKQKSVEKYETSSAPKSLKSKKKNK